jgi:hypothetical protein
MMIATLAAELQADIVWGHKKRPFQSPERPMKCGFYW